MILLIFTSILLFKGKSAAAMLDFPLFPSQSGLNNVANTNPAEIVDKVSNITAHPEEIAKSLTNPSLATPNGAFTMDASKLPFKNDFDPGKLQNGLMPKKLDNKFDPLKLDPKKLEKELDPRKLDPALVPKKLEGGFGGKNLGGLPGLGGAFGGAKKSLNEPPGEKDKKEKRKKGKKPVKSSAKPASSSKKRKKEPPTWILKRGPGQSKDYHKVTVPEPPTREVDCVKSYFMSPLHKPVDFSLNSTIYTRFEKTCRWNFFGTEQCIPTLSCNITRMHPSCEREYLEIVDGTGGVSRVCGGKHQIVNLQASGDLRDLYIRFKVNKSRARPRNVTWEKFQCEVVCGKRGEGTPLQKNFLARINPRCYCGTKPNEERIMGGQHAKKSEFPWLVAFVETNTRQPFCGGSIINNRFILTAAHCFRGSYNDYKKVQVIVNGHMLDSSLNPAVAMSQVSPKIYSATAVERMDKSNGSRRYNIEEIIVHPLYVSENNDFDVALVKLTEDLPLTPFSVSIGLQQQQQPRALCLPPLGSYLRTYSGKKAVVAGWGLPGIDSAGTTPVLQKLEVNVFSPKECKSMYDTRVNRRMMCAGHREGNMDSCAGDSGGPLMLEGKRKTWLQIGSVSFGEGCGIAMHPGVYFRATEGVQWYTYVSNYMGGRAEDKGEEEQSATWCLTP